MIRRAKRELLKLSSTLSDVQLIGGSADVTRRRFAFSVDSDGALCSDLAPVKLSKSYMAYNIVYGRYFPSIGCSLLVNKSGNVYRLNLTSGAIKTTGSIGACVPTAVTVTEDDVNYVYLIGKTSACKISADTNSTVKLDGKLTSGLYRCGRVFGASAADGYTLRWSGFSITDWEDGISGGGSVTLDGAGGAIVDVAEIGDKLLCLREGGITLMNGLADSRNFRIAPSGRLIRIDNVVSGGAAEGGKYWFSCADGLYSFDGTDVERVVASPQGAAFGIVRAAGDGYVYAEYKTADSVSVLLRYRPSDGSYMYFGKGCSIPWLVDGVYYCSNSSLIKTLTYGAEYSLRRWTSEKITLGTAKRKTLKAVTVDKDDGITLSVTCNGQETSLVGNGKVAVGLRAEDFTFTVAGYGDIRTLIAHFEVTT